MLCCLPAADVFLSACTSELTLRVLPMGATTRIPVAYPDIGDFSEYMQDWVAEGYQCGDIDGALDALDADIKRMDSGLDLDNRAWLARNSWGEHVERMLSVVSGVSGCLK